jgi:hypothetical protein
LLKNIFNTNNFSAVFAIDRIDSSKSYVKPDQCPAKLICTKNITAVFCDHPAAGENPGNNERTAGDNVVIFRESSRE